MHETGTQLKHRRLIGLRPLVHRALQVADPVLGRLICSEVEMAEGEPLAVVVPLHEKDLPLAAEAISFVRRNLRHPISEVVVIAADTEKVRGFCQENGARWIDEERALPISSKEVKAALAEFGYGNWGWVYQQLIKLNVDKVVPSGSFLVLDADTVLARPIVFKRDGVLYQQFSHERNPYYRKSYERLLGAEMEGTFSYVCHYMFAEARVLRALRSEIREHCERPWYEAILAQANPELWPVGVPDEVPFNFFSEYETYGNFCRKFYDDVKGSYFFNRSASDFRAEEESVGEYVARMPHIYQWVSFHHYLYT